MLDREGLKVSINLKLPTTGHPSKASNTEVAISPSTAFYNTLQRHLPPLLVTFEVLRASVLRYTHITGV